MESEAQVCAQSGHMVKLKCVLQHESTTDIYTTFIQWHYMAG